MTAASSRDRACEESAQAHERLASDARGTSDAASSADRMARITWSLLAEPSDDVAHSTCTVHGVREGLEILARGDLDAVEHALRILPVHDPTAPRAQRMDRRAAAAAGLSRWKEREGRIDARSVLDRAAGQGMRVIVPGDAQWPAGLDDLGPAAPFCLWAHGPGDPARLADERAIAMVGSRASTPYGEDCASSMAAQLAAEGSTVLSGGAYGIDAAAHRGALAAGGPTIAVLAGGLDRLYPRGNDQLLRAIRERHVLLSEAPPGTAPTRWRFLARNRLIAALARIVVVVEAAWRSGALSTARHAGAIEPPRTVAALPGPVTSAASAGCHRLVRDGQAVLVTEAQEIRELLPHSAPAGDSSFAQQDELDLLDPADRHVLDAVPPRSRITIDRLASEVGRRESEVMAALGRLDALGHVRITGENVGRR
ncbi:DNA-processing protein DprA [Brachybacterium halotolerans subsp. kimchii]|uniref:DNA-processing protein DprA n=1 Tax=Brachybacterium halotolerans TaxID=2795215 RepID=UPI001E3080E8|nr:DNA-processing protein DprA [Brachybacterium halotolerans]UEJ83731.1 DNA-processing protein DprA [Brachybacterium halotolerans subsp. kimchii]